MSYIAQWHPYGAFKHLDIAHQNLHDGNTSFQHRSPNHSTWYDVRDELHCFLYYHIPNTLVALQRTSSVTWVGSLWKYPPSFNSGAANLMLDALGTLYRADSPQLATDSIEWYFSQLKLEQVPRSSKTGLKSTHTNRSRDGIERVVGEMDRFKVHEAIHHLSLRSTHHHLNPAPTVHSTCSANLPHTYICRLAWSTETLRHITPTFAASFMPPLVSTSLCPLPSFPALTAPDPSPASCFPMHAAPVHTRAGASSHPPWQLEVGILATRYLAR